MEDHELYGVPKKIITIIQKVYEESNSAVKVDGDMSSWFQAGDNRCSTRLHPIATAVCNNDRLDTQEEHRKKCR